MWSIFIAYLYGILIMMYSVYGELFKECSGNETFNRFVPSFTSCSIYIYCDGENSFQGACLADNYFNVEIEACDDPPALHCHLTNDDNKVTSSNGTDTSSGRETSITNEQTNETHIDQSIAMLNGTQMNIVNGVESFIGIQSTIIVPVPVIIQSLSQYLPALEETQCPIIYHPYDVIYLPNRESCSSYYICYNGIAIPMACARNMYYNSMARRCERLEGPSCSLQLIPPLQPKCDRGVFDFMPHPRNCQYYYLCANGFLMISQCPFNFTWHYERRTCVHHTQGKCFTSTTAAILNDTFNI